MCVHNVLCLSLKSLSVSSDVCPGVCPYYVLDGSGEVLGSSPQSHLEQNSIGWFTYLTLLQGVGLSGAFKEEKED